MLRTERICLRAYRDKPTKTDPLNVVDQGKFGEGSPEEGGARTLLVCEPSQPRLGW